MMRLGGLAAGLALSIVAVAAAEPGPGADPEQRSALLRVFQSTNGAHWTNTTGWTSDSSYCTWYGVRCGADGNVGGLELARNNLTGIFPQV